MKVLIVGDSRKMKGGVSTVIKSMEANPIWKKYNCYWLQCQINKGIVWKVMYLVMGLLNSLFRVPFYNIVHFHTTPGPGMKVVLPIILYTLLWRKKIVLHLHMGNQMRDYKDSKVFNWVMAHSDKVIVLGKIWQQFLIDEMKVRTSVEYLYNPVPENNAPRRNNADKSKYFLFAAFFNINKGYDILLKAFAQVVKKYPDWRLVMCGVGNVEEVKAFISENGVGNNVDLPGWVDGKERESYFNNAYAYCMTSRKEGLPMAVLECLSIGVPVISTPVGCLPEFLTDNENIMFFDFEDSDNLANQMIRLVEDKDLYNRLSENGVMVIADSFASTKVFEKLDRIYQDLIRE